MRTLRLVPPGFLLLLGVWTGGLWIGLPGRSAAYVVFGDTLDLGQRDFRIFNNFSDPEANDNLVPDPDFPGAIGAELAIWKGVAEWGSAPHGSGTTDPTQAGIGSGSSNFDAFYSGESTDAGPKNSNVISELFGSSFVYAFTEIPIRDGWRIRFYSAPHVWNDGPSGDLSGGSDAVDIQGVAAHEYGHALGLDHSLDADATMYGALVAQGVPQRSIEADDVAGVQYLYGVRDATKPRITGYDLVPGGVLVSGEHFHPSLNEIWFTHRTPLGGADGTPVRVTGVPSGQGGRSLHVALPPDAGPGDLLVRVPGQAFGALSNAWPFDPEHEHLDPPESYGQGKVTSAGLEARLTAISLPSTRVGSFHLQIRDGMPNRPGILMSSAERANLPFQGGTWLLGASDARRDVAFTLSFIGDAQLSVPSPPELLGTTRYFQAWFQDPGDSFGSGLTNGVRVTYLP